MDTLPVDVVHALLDQVVQQSESLRRIRDMLEGRDASYTNGRRTVQPAAGDVLASLGIPPPGKYEIKIFVTVSAASDTGNAELRVGSRVELPGLGGAATYAVTLIRQIDGETAVTVNATAAAGVGVIYGVAIVATRIE
jgi:hypothetical protein